MIAEAELSRVQRRRARLGEQGLCARCGKINDRPEVTTCRACFKIQAAQGKQWRKEHPGYMKSYGKQYRRGHKEC